MLIVESQSWANTITRPPLEPSLCRITTETMANDELKIFTPIGMLGYSFSEQIFWSTLDDGVDAIILDSGSTDSGPSKLAFGHTSASREAYVRDLTLLVKACHQYKVPVLIGNPPTPTPAPIKSKQTNPPNHLTPTQAPPAATAPTPTSTSSPPSSRKSSRPSPYPRSKS